MTERAAESPGGVTAQHTFFALASAGLVVAALYLGQRIFVPLAFALLLTLILSPVVSRLERRRLGRLPAVLSVAFLAFTLIGFVGWAVADQFTDLLSDLPRHKGKVRDKLAQLRGTGEPGVLGKVQDFLEEFEEPAPFGDSDTTAPQVVRVQPSKPSLLAQYQGILGRVAANISVLVAVIFLVVTLLIYREDARNRLIRLAGGGRLTVTTRALDEAGRRISGYLLGHSAVNAGFGVAVGLGLAALEIPYSVLWGLLAGALRFVPSIGIWLVAPLPAALAFVSTPDLLVPYLVLGLFLVLDFVTSTLVEPRVCGKSVGLAPVPLLLAVMFWTGLWGMVGLVLATPVTVCLAVLGKYVPQLSFLGVLLSKEAALTPAARYYQRLLARDRHEAEAVVKEYLAEHSVEELFDLLLLPALALVRAGRKQRELRPEDEEFILQSTRAIVEGLDLSTSPAVGESRDGPIVVVGVPAADRVDETALHMLRHLAFVAGIDLVVVADGVTTPVPGATAILVSALGPGGLTEARFLCRRMHGQYPGARVFVGRWGRGRNRRKARRLLLAAGAQRIFATLREARTELARQVPAPHPNEPLVEQSV